MRFTLSITHCAFPHGNPRRHGHRVAVIVEYGNRHHTLGTDVQIFRPTNRVPIPTEGDCWRHEVVIDRRHGTPHVTIRALILKESREHLEEIVHTWSAGLFYDTVRIEGEQAALTVHSSANRHESLDVIYTRRSGPEAHAPQIAHLPRSVVHVEVDPVIPWAVRPPTIRPAWTEVIAGTHQTRLDIITPPSALNPSVLPSWHRAGAPPPGWRNRWRAEYRVTRCYWRGMFDRSQLEWSFESISGDPSIEFIGNNLGYEVELFARGEGEGRMVVSRRTRTRADPGGTTQVLTKVRVLIRQPARIATRAIVVMPETTASPGDVAALQRMTRRRFNDALRVANRYLRQVAVELAPATFAHTQGPTINVPMADLESRTAHFGLADTITFVVVHSATEVENGITVPSGTLGYAAGIPQTGAPHEHPHAPGSRDAACIPGSLTLATFTDSGTPSTSLVPPTGIPPDGPAVDQTLGVIQRGVHDQGVVFLVLAAPGDESGVSGATIAHEVGHVLNLAHRYQDGIPWLGSQNLMLSSSRSSDANDIDVAQAKVIWHSPLVQR